ncbi:hypothetical protein JIN77_13390 [Verrucomicrobiaceae bacterium R5-34]|uniref:DUF4138 domain-containing protein n=1 Tax=Oceaniferula flava TaxID=2800421 RepID=A0AAE2SAC5_9BACT|nr:hypothetical protein [Oceaniferula flavus]MBK1831724.1 hypothetical protein [Verrucomicrobiaceae bacterium R5-34]MBK1853939.1 hypothetical protein [Oceaniferula flavus]MBM1135245.1 hypothetical protein [Oceaniferula flavus]
MISRILIPLLALCFASSAAIAQDKITDPNQLPPLPTPQAEDLVCKCVTTFQLKKDDVFFLKVGENYYQIELYGETVSQPLPVRGARTFTLYKQVTDEEGKVTYKPAVQQALSGTGKSHLVILKRKDAKSPITSAGLNLSSSSMPANNIYFYNESTAPLGLQVNTTKTVVQPFSKFTYPFVNTTRNTYTSAKVIMRYKGENKIMSSKRLRLVPGRRIILIAFPSVARAKLGSTPLRMLAIQDMPK